MAVTPLRERTRREIEQQAIVLFSDKGYLATSLQDIATAAGCSKATVLYHFTSKAAVLASVLEQPSTLLVTLLDQASRLLPAEAQELTINGFVDLGVRFRGLLNVLNDVIPSVGDIPELEGLVAAGDKLARLLAGSDLPEQIAMAKFAIHGLIGACRVEHLEYTEEELRDLCLKATRRLLTP